MPIEPGGSLLQAFRDQSRYVTVSGPDMVSAKSAYRLNLMPSHTRVDGQVLPQTVWLADLGNGIYCPVQTQRTLSGKTSLMETVTYDRFGQYNGVTFPTGWTYSADLQSTPSVDSTLWRVVGTLTYSNFNREFPLSAFQIDYPPTASVYTDGRGWRCDQPIQSALSVTKHSDLTRIILWAVIAITTAGLLVKRKPRVQTL